MITLIKCTFIVRLRSEEALCRIFCRMFRVLNVVSHHWVLIFTLSVFDFLWLYLHLGEGYGEDLKSLFFVCKFIFLKMV